MANKTAKIEPQTAKEETLDAAGQAVGRVASRAAFLLRGKNRPDFDPGHDPKVKLVILNAGKVKFTGRKLEQKDYYHHTNYPGGIKRTPMKKIFLADPTKVMIAAISKMLPRNSFRKEMLKRLIVKA